MRHDAEYFVFSNRDNCEKESAKVFRQYYKRPYFLPPMAEAVEGNWFLVSSGENKILHVSFSTGHHSRACLHGERVLRLTRLPGKKG